MARLDDKVEIQSWSINFKSENAIERDWKRLRSLSCFQKSFTKCWRRFSTISAITSRLSNWENWPIEAAMVSAWIILVKRVT